MTRSEIDSEGSGAREEVRGYYPTSHPRSGPVAGSQGRRRGN
jgi:hypothetical protein